MTKALLELANELRDAAHYCTEISWLEDRCREVAGKLEGLAEDKHAVPPTAREPKIGRVDREGGWNAARDIAALSVPPGDQAREASSALTKLAAECHRAKWEFDLSDDYKPTASAARGLILKAFQELHRIGDIAMNLRAEVKKP